MIKTNNTKEMNQDNPKRKKYNASRRKGMNAIRLNNQKQLHQIKKRHERQ